MFCEKLAHFNIFSYLCQRITQNLRNMENVTIIKRQRQTETLRIISIEQLIESIRQQVYQEDVNMVRTYYPMMTPTKDEQGEINSTAPHAQKLPRICFSSELENKKHQRINRAYTGLVLLEVNHLQSYEEAAAIRSGAAQMPQTLAAFVGTSGRSVKIVCRGELYKQQQDAALADNHLPTAPEDIERFHLNLYEKARMAYNGQLGVTIEKLEPLLERTCYMSIDQDAVYNPLSIPFYVELTTVEKAVGTITHSTIEPQETAPGLNRYLSLHNIYEWNMQKAYEELRNEGISDNDDEELYAHLLAEHLADQCCQTDIPMAVALQLTRHRLPFRGFEPLVRQVFENAYRQQNEKSYRRRKNIVKPMKNVPQEMLLAMKIDIFLRENYELRMNIMRGVAEYRQRTGLGFDFQDLTEQARNSITIRALEQGIKCWDKDIRRYVNSDDIEQYDPMNDFLDHLPGWDGLDRVTPLALRVPTLYKEWPHLFHIWMRSMVAMWQGKGQLTGNALVPLLIGRQGCGKTSFCRILLPRDQREYYNDRINFKSENDLNLGLTSFALINLDEFDQVTQRQQIVLKYLVSTSDLKYRPPYGKAYTQHRRYASFIGTTNQPTPLVDPSGSRRFVCVQVEGNIDFQSPVDYPQLYAQLCHEVAAGERYWLTKDEEQQLMRHNLHFQRLNGLGEMLLSLFQKPLHPSSDATSQEPAGSNVPTQEPTASNTPAQGHWVSLSEISARLKATFRSAYKEEPGTLEKLGNFMNRPEYKFESRRKTSGMEYFVSEVV